MLTRQRQTKVRIIFTIFHKCDLVFWFNQFSVSRSIPEYRELIKFLSFENNIELDKRQTWGQFNFLVYFTKPNEKKTNKQKNQEKEFDE